MQMNYLIGQTEIYVDAKNLDSGHHMAPSTKVYRVGGHVGMRLSACLVHYRPPLMPWLDLDVFGNFDVHIATTCINSYIFGV